MRFDIDRAREFIARLHESDDYIFAPRGAHDRFYTGFMKRSGLMKSYCKPTGRYIMTELGHKLAESMENEKWKNVVWTELADEGLVGLRAFHHVVDKVTMESPTRSAW